jgi:hypothetical protein
VVAGAGDGSSRELEAGESEPEVGVVPDGVGGVGEPAAMLLCDDRDGAPRRGLEECRELE